MAIRRRPDGTWEFDSIEEAIQFDRRLATPLRAAEGGPTARTHEDVHAPAISRQPVRSDRLPQEERVAKALQMLAAADARGLLTEEMAPMLELANLKGFSGVAQAIRKRIIEVATNGTHVSKVFWSSGKKGRPARWHVDAHKLKEFGLLE